MPKQRSQLIRLATQVRTGGKEFFANECVVAACNKERQLRGLGGSSNLNRADGVAIFRKNQAFREETAKVETRGRSLARHQTAGVRNERKLLIAHVINTVGVV